MIALGCRKQLLQETLAKNLGGTYFVEQLTRFPYVTHPPTVERLKMQMKRTRRHGCAHVLVGGHIVHFVDHPPVEEAIGIDILGRVHVQQRETLGAPDELDEFRGCTGKRRAPCAVLARTW